MTQTLSATSFIEEYEIEEAKKLIEDMLGFPAPIPAGRNLVVKLFIREEDVRKITRPDGTTVSIAIPEITRVQEKFRSCVALVLSVGPDAYKGKDFERGGPICRIGDWVTIPRNEGIQVNYRGVPVHYIKDKYVYCVNQAPGDVRKMGN